MSEQQQNALPKKPKLSRHGGANAAKKDKTKAHSYDARNYHQNANRHGIHALVKFDCPICQCKNTVVVEPDVKHRTAVVRCVYCVSLKPQPPDLPYPFTTTLVPKLENKADAFFRFSEAYHAIARAQGAHASDGASVSVPAGAPSGLGLLDSLADAEPACTAGKKRAREDSEPAASSLAEEDDLGGDADTASRNGERDGRGTAENDGTPPEQPIAPSNNADVIDDAAAFFLDED